MQRLTITVPDHLATEVRRRVRFGDAPSVSAYVSRAIERELDDDLLTELDRLDEELGPPTVEDYAWADSVIARLR